VKKKVTPSPELLGLIKCTLVAFNDILVMGIADKKEKGLLSQMGKITLSPFFFSLSIILNNLKDDIAFLILEVLKGRKNTSVNFMRDQRNVKRK